MVKTEKKDECEVQESSYSKNKQKSQGRKRKRSTSESSNDNAIIFADNALEMEMNVHVSAVKNNLDETCVRKIIKKVVTNDHVLALVKLQEEAADSSAEDKSLQPKLTRAKVKELKKVSACRSSAWDLEKLELTPIKHIPVKTRPEVKALIAQELPDDEDDEEYEPTHDDVPSDDEHVESCSDLDSQPRTPATPAHADSPQVVKDGPFKVPQDILTARRKLELEAEEATIALRTRSKLSLSSTSIEHIESTFVPPDDIPVPDVDDLWNQFLNECLDPASAAKNEDDDDADPEYNVAADPDAHDEDEEALSNSIIKISKKELNDLVTELFSILPGADDDIGELPSEVSDTSHTNITQWEGKQEPVSDDENGEKPSKKLKFEKETEQLYGKDVCAKEINRQTNGKEINRGTSGKEINSPISGKEINRPNNRKETNIQTSEKVINREIHKKEMKDQLHRDDVNAQSEKEKVQLGIPILPKSKPSNISGPCLTITGNNSHISISIEERDPHAPPPAADAEPPPALRTNLRTEQHTLRIQLEPTVTMTPEQTLILQQQLRQHIQLAASNFMQTVVHPVHWKLGPTYKEYLVSLTSLAEKKEDSVANVCNLKPAFELITNWEKTITEDTDENRKIIEFLQNEVDKSRRRIHHNSVYGGQFHDTFMKVVANSTVFLYPYLLPGMPFRADAPRRSCYLRTEDALMVLGLDQFWSYVESNPDMFKLKPGQSQRGRPGFVATVKLVVKHMFPWMTPNRLAARLSAVRVGSDKDNPIYKYFKHNELPKIEHMLLPYNPKLTLYEQPEHEMPRIWVRYLAKTSQRFKNYLYKRSTHVSRLPTGVQIHPGVVPETNKKPLPIDFTKKIIDTRAALNAEPPEPPLADKFDINIQKPETNAVAQGSLATKNVYRLVETSTGAYLVPMQVQTKTVDTATGPVMTPAEISSLLPNNILEEERNVTPNLEHCMCCVILRKICKERQSLITEYFSNVVKKCDCNSISYPKISNRLRLLVKNYKKSSELAFKELEKRLKGCEMGDTEEEALNYKDLVQVISYQLKVFTQASISRRIHVKKRVSNLLHRFDLDKGDPVVLAAQMFNTYDAELMDLYLDFLGFLTPEQADLIGVYKDYFTRNCAGDLMEKVEEQVTDREARNKILDQLKKTFTIVATSCEMCASLLGTMGGYPALARYCFNMFPHRKENRAQIRKINLAPVNITEEQIKGNDTTCDAPSITIDYEADHSSSGEESDTMSVDLEPMPEASQDTSTIVKTEPTTEPEISVSISPDIKDDQNSDTSSEDNLKIEETTDWTKEEDRLILLVLQEYMTREERKNLENKSIIDLLEEKNVYGMLDESLIDRSLNQIKERVLYLLTMSVISENDT